MQEAWMRKIGLMALTAALALLAACSTPYKTPALVANGGGDTHFSGLVDLFGPEQTLDVLLVHGMCTHDARWAHEAVQNLSTLLGGSGADVQLKAVAVAGTDIVLHQQTLLTSQGRLRANAIVWSPLTAPLKAQLCYDQTNKSASCPPDEAAKAYPYQRAALNRLLKDSLMDDCLADALIYQGRSRDGINQQMQQAILQAVATSGGSAMAAQTPLVAAAAAVPGSQPLVVLTESLGSKLAFDALYKLSRNAQTEAAGDQIWRRITQIFMGANQLPILALADSALDANKLAASRDEDAASYPADPIGALMRGAPAKRRPSVQMTRLPGVVAFTDPNDLLSYLLSPSPHAVALGYPVVDVAVSNASTYFGVLEMPTSAHGGYLANRAVRSLIACGHPKRAACGD